MYTYQICIAWTSVVVKRHWRTTTGAADTNNNNNTNTNDNVYGAVIMTQSLREFTRFIWRTQTSARWPSTLRPGQPTWAVSPPVCCYMAYIRHRHLSITQLESWYSFYRPTEGGRLSQPRHTACTVMWLYSTTLHMGVRNLPKVLTRQRPGRELNPVSAIHKSDALPVSHRATQCQLMTNCQYQFKWKF